MTHSLETSIAEIFKGSAPTLLIANTLRRLGENRIKVCCEIVMEVVDAWGLIPEGEEVVAAAGSGRGSGRRRRLRSAASKRFLSLMILEIWGQKTEC